MTLLKLAGTLLTACIAFAALITLVAEPFEMNQKIAVVDEQFRQGMRSPVQIRQSFEGLGEGAVDPYLRGQRDLYRARLLAQLGRLEDANEAYDRALKGRVPPEIIVEAALWRWRSGDVEASRSLLVRANRFSPFLTTYPLATDSGLYREMIEAAEREALLNR